MQHTLHTVSQSWRSEAEILTYYFRCCYSLNRQADIHRQTVACVAAAATSEWLMGQTAMQDEVRMLRHLVDGQNAVHGAIARKWKLC
jgi:phenylalanyl-tRNA synthetase beta subunit